ncbi:MAG: oxygenase MpaB family protein [Pseudonocardiaceae bacterium]
MADDLGYFGPDSVTWRVLADPAASVGGIRALFLQALHPLAMAAVHQHTDISGDFWPRLHRTAQYVTTVGFGTRAEADAAAARVRAIHRTVRGIDPVTGRAYAATDPDLLRWVHAAEMASFLDAVSRSGLPLTGAEANRFLVEQVRAAELVGLQDVPTSRAALVKYFEQVRPELYASPVTRRAALRLALPPLSLRTELTTPARPLWTGLAGLAFMSLPRWARRLYGLPGPPTTDLAVTVLLRGLRTTALRVPERWRHGPLVQQALARARRVSVTHALGLTDV